MKLISSRPLLLKRKKLTPITWQVYWNFCQKLIRLFYVVISNKILAKDLKRCDAAQEITTNINRAVWDRSGYKAVSFGMKTEICGQLPLFAAVPVIVVVVVVVIVVIMAGLSVDAARKVPEFGVFSGPYFPALELNLVIYNINLHIQVVC